MKFSLITPVKAEELPQLLALKRNLSQQTMQDFEWLIATDLTLDLQSPTWQTPFPIRLIQPTVPTIGAARNAALASAKGDWLVFMDSDDYLLPEALAHLDGTNALTPTVMADLHQYPTYEPHTAFINTLSQTIARDSLPKGTGSKRKKVTYRPLDLPADLTTETPNDLPIKAQNWLNYKYRLYQDTTRWDNFKRQLSIAGKVINRELVQQAKIQFDATNPLYPDSLFLTQVMAHTSAYLQLANPTYIRVRHNDPINAPSVHQLPTSRRWHNRLAAWQLSLDQLSAGNLRDAFATYTLNRLHRYLYKSLSTNTDDTIADPQDLAVQLQRYLQSIDTPSSFQAMPLLSRQILHHFQQHGTIPQGQINTIVRLRQLRRVIKHHGRGVTRLAYDWWFTKLPVKPKTILYESFLGRNFSDSPKAIYQHLQANYPGKFKHIWVMADHTDTGPGNQPDTKVVKRFGWRYMYYLATAKYQVINMRQPKWFIKRPGTKFLATWHGTPLKHLVFDMDNVASANPHYKEIFYQQSRQWDYLITANQFSVDVFEHAFMYPTQKMLSTGYPRNDILSAPDKASQANNIKQKLGIPLDKKVILYAPTWRDDDYYSVGNYKFTLKLDIPRLKRELGQDYVLVLRTHYFITDHLDTTGFGDFVYNESSYDDISELYLISDVLITDYSSVFFDYAILKRPILYFVYDYEKYRSVLRGFYLNMETDLPGPLLKTNDEVLGALHNLPAVERQYRDAYQQFSKRFNAWEDGHATQRVVNTFFDLK